MSTLTTLREALVPFLPPPAVKLLHVVDASLASPSLPEPSMAILLSLLLLFLFTTLLTRFSSSTGTSSRSLASKRVPRDAVVFFGPRSSGKTILLHSLLGINNLTTVTSMSVTEKLSPPFPPLIDCPGHPRLLATTSLYLRRAKTVFFVVDSSAAKNLPVAGTMLYKILTSPHLPGCSQIVIICAKSDLPLSKSPLRIRSSLTSTIDSLRISASTTQTTGVLGDNVGTNDITESITLDVGEDRGFNFDKHSPVSVKFIKSSAKGGIKDGEGMQELMEIINSM